MSVKAKSPLSNSSNHGTPLLSQAVSRNNNMATADSIGSTNIKQYNQPKSLQKEIKKIEQFN